MKKFQWHELKLFDYQKSELKIKMNDFLIKPSRTSVMLAIEKLKEEIKPAVTKKRESELWDKPIVIAVYIIFGNFG